MRILALTLILSVLVAVIPLPVAADRGAGGIMLSATPTTIPADGKSFTTVMAEVRDEDGKFAPDGTEIRFTASLGEIEEVGVVQSGMARVKMQSTTMPGTSIITATWIEGQAVARTSVQFGASEVPQGPEYIDVSAEDYLAYSVDFKTLEAMGSVKLRYKAIEIEAESIQVDLENSRIVAKGVGRDKPVRLKSREGTTEASLFSYDFFGAHGIILSAGQGKVQQVKITGSQMALTDNAMYTPDEFDFRDLSLSGILIKAKHATIFPDDKIQFRRTNVFVDGKKMLSLPLYVLSLTPYQADAEQYVGYSTGGITLSLPFYYALSPKSSGAMLVRHGQSTGWGDYSQTPGWFVDLRQKYVTDRSESVLSLNHVTTKWGANLTHNQRFADNSNAFFLLDYPAHESLYGTLNYNKPLGALNLGLNLFGNKQEQYDGQSVTKLNSIVSLQTRSKRIGKTGISYSVVGRAFNDWTRDESTGSTDWVPNSTYRLDSNLYSSPLAFSRDLSLRCAGGLGYVFGAGDLSGLSTNGTAVLDWRMSDRNNFQVSYRISTKPTLVSQWKHTDNETAEMEREYVGARDKTQSLSGLLRLGDGRKWTASAYAIKGLDYPSLNIFADLSYRLDDQWRLSVRSTSNTFGYQAPVMLPDPLDSTKTITVWKDVVSKYSDVEFAVGKRFGSRELLAVWSQKEKKIMFELGSSGF